jgi:hypothetical protein
VQAAAGTAQQAAEATIRVLATPFTTSKTRSRLAGTTAGKARGAPASPAPSALAGAGWHALSDHEIDSLEPREYDHLTPIHLKTPPPDPWTVQPKRRVATFEEKMVHSLVTGRGGAPTSSGRLRGRAPGSVQPQVSGTSAGQQRTITAGRGMSGSTALRDAQDGSMDTAHDVKLEGGTATVAPILRKGYITNPQTGRQIKVRNSCVLEGPASAFPLPCDLDSKHRLCLCHVYLPRLAGMCTISSWNQDMCLMCRQVSFVNQVQTCQHDQQLDEGSDAYAGMQVAAVLHLSQEVFSQSGQQSVAKDQCNQPPLGL